MTEIANPKGAAQALAGKIYLFRGRKLRLTQGVLCALDILGLDNATVADARLVFAVTVIGGMPPEKVEELLQLGKDALTLAIFSETKTLIRGRKALREASRITEEMILDYNRSVCVYEPPDGGTSSAPVCGIGCRAAAFASLSRRHHCSWREFLDMPATRANILLASENEYAGNRGVKTFVTEEMLENAERVFSEIEKINAEKHNG